MEKLMWVTGSWEVTDDPVLESTNAGSEVGGREMGRVFWNTVTSVCRREAPYFHGTAATGRVGILHLTRAIR